MKDLAPVEIARIERITTRFARATDLDPSVHATRKSIKRLRAFLRLARRAIGTSTYRTENAALRDTARLLAPARDAFVLIETARGLGASESVLAALAVEHRRAIEVLETTTRNDVVHRLEAISNRWKSIEWHGPDSRSIGAGLLRTYRRGLVDFETVAAAPTATAFHGWRRRVKYLRYQLEALGAPHASVAPYTALGDDLGLEHDQAVLIGVCELHVDDAAYTSLARRSSERRNDLRASAIDLGMRLFDQEPEAFRDAVYEL